MHQRLQDNSPLAVLILASLVDGPKSATTLHERVIQADGLLIEPGAFAREVARMERWEWIVSYQDGEGLRRYQITNLGMLALQANEQSNQEHYEREKERMMPIVLWILRLYPPGWRERYEAEMEALLSQHHITLWTVLDLLMGALDARLDPYYRRERQLLPLRRYKSSWRLLLASFVAFWFALLPWFWMSQIGLDDADCSAWSVWKGNSALCMLRKTLGTVQYSAPGLLIGLILIFLPILLMLFMTVLVVARGKKAHTHVQLAQVVTVGMIMLCLVCGFWLGGIWQLLPQISRFYPQTPAGLIIGTGGMGLATVLALGALARASSALRAMEQAAPKQEASLAGTAGLSSSPFDHQKDDRYVEARSAEESVGEQQEMPMVSRASAPVREKPATSFAEAHATRKGARGGWALLMVLVLLFIVPWPALISGDSPDHPTLLFNWLLAVVVGLITAWLVKEPGKTWKQRASRKYRRATSPLWWVVILPTPAMPFFLFGGIGDGPRGWLLLLLAGIVGGATALIVKIRMGHLRPKSPLVVLVLATIFLLLGVGQAVSLHAVPLLFLLSLVCIFPAFFVRVAGRKQQVGGTSELQDIGAGAAPKVVGWVFFLLACNIVYAQVSSTLYLNQGQYPLPVWTGWGEILMSIVMVICLIPALVVNIQTSNRWGAGAREPVQNDISPRVWILVLPVIFLMCVTQMAYIIGTDAGSTFANVFIYWLLAGLAALIMLLAFRLGSRKRRTTPEREPSQAHMQVQG